MAKNIALTLTIGGVKQNIQNINELEKAVKEAQEQLKGMEIGSEGFKKLSAEVKNAKGVIEDFGKSIKGEDLQKRIGAFAKLGEGITASFAGAQAAISLFGNESEAVAQAAAKAQSILTIALAARSAAEGVVAVRTVAANIATAASAAAANAATVATRTLYATLAANPYGAILAVIGLVVGALIALTSSTKEQINVQKELSKVTSDEATSLKNSLVILTQFNGQRELQRKEIEKLNKQYPGFNAFIDKENRLNQKGVEFIKLKIKQYELEAQAKLIVQKIAENSIKLLEIEQKSALDSLDFWDKFKAAIISGGNAAVMLQQEIKIGIENQREAIAEISAENERWRKSLSNVYIQTDEVLKQIKPFNEELDNQVIIEKNLETAKQKSLDKQKQLNDAYQKGKTASIDLSKAINELNKTFQRYEQTLKNLESIKYDAQIIKQLENIKEARVAATKELIDGLDDIKRNIQELGTTLPSDPLILFFVELRDELETEFTKIGTQAFVGFNKVYENFITELTKRGVKLSTEQQQILQQIAIGYEDLGSIIQNTAGFKEYLQSLTGINVAWDDFRINGNKAYNTAEAFMMIIGEITAANRTFVEEFRGGSGIAAELLKINGLPDIEPIKFDLAKVQQNSRQYISELEKSLFKPIAERLVQQEIKIQQDLLKSTTDDVVKREIEGKIETLVKQLNSVRTTGKLVAEFSQTTTQQVETEVSKIVGEFLKLTNAVVAAEQRILLVNKEVNKLTKELQANTTELSQAIGGVVLQNIDAISTLLLGARTKEQKIEKDFIDKVKADRQGLENFKKQLIDLGVDVEKASYDDLLKAYIEYKKKELAVDKQTEKDKKDARQQTFQDLDRGFQQFSQVLNQTSATVQERVRADLEMLQVAQQKALDQVVGDTETAAAKRLEIQAEYEQKQKEIEKRGRITSLQFSLVQTIANGAQAAVKALAELGPILGPILAGVNSAIALAQVVIIQDQIAATRALRRGGMVRAQSGMLLQGPSHEQGGIPLAQMGIVAEGNESIINRQSSINFRDLLSTINQSGGGRPLVVNNFDDSRIVEALAKQKQTPIRAYVLGSEITNEQMISKRLDDLSKL
jgi:DNA repair exonuclease SbcCD ATPase subunit